MSALEALEKYIDQHDDEAIDGSLLKEVVPMVDLEMAAVPLCVECRCDDWQRKCPNTVRYELWDNPRRWAIVRPDRHDFDIVPEESLKRMRGRFLLMNGWYYRHWYKLSHSMQGEVWHNFLRHTQQVPPSPKSEFGKMLGIVE